MNNPVITLEMSKNFMAKMTYNAVKTTIMYKAIITKIMY